MLDDPKQRITDALTDPDERTDMLSVFVSKEQKRFDTHLVYGSGVYKIKHFLELLKTDRRQQMAMKGKGVLPRNEQLKEAMVASKDTSVLNTGNQPIDNYVRHRDR